jgi:GT2 family glycosyltransferase
MDEAISTQLSVVVVTYQSAACVGQCLASVRSAFPDAELIVVDNGSQDETSKVVRSTAAEARLVENRMNLGFGRACNIGARAATGSHILFINPDAGIESVDKAATNDLLSTRPFGLIAPTLVGELDSRKAEVTWLVDYAQNTFDLLRPKEWKRTARTYRSSRPAWVSGAILVVARDEFTNLGGFDRRFFLYYEDRDLSRRYREAKLPVRATNAIKGHHLGSSSSTLKGVPVEPIGWRLLSWIQYLSIHEGERSARRATLAVLGTLHALHLGVRFLAVTRWSRAARKAEQLERILAFLADGPQRGAEDFCPDALRIVRGVP